MMKKDIPGFEGLYQAAVDGRIISLPKFIHGASGGVRYQAEMVLTPDVGQKGYARVVLFKNKKRYRFLVHRIIATTFIENDLSRSDVNHKNGNKSDNRVENLEWCTKSENIRHSFTKLGRVATTNMAGKTNEKHHNSKRIIQLDLTGSVVKEWPNAQEVARQHGYSSQNISNCAVGRLKSAYGFIWKHA